VLYFDIQQSLGAIQLLGRLEREESKKFRGTIVKKGFLFYFLVELNERPIDTRPTNRGTLCFGAPIYWAS
jgi:hypothetical protein